VHASTGDLLWVSAALGLDGPFVHGNEIAHPRTDVYLSNAEILVSGNRDDDGVTYLTRPPDLHTSWLKHHLAPVRKPPYYARDGE
jgi:hypothetical protein